MLRLMSPRRDDCNRWRRAGCLCLAAVLLASPLSRADACSCAHRSKPFELLTEAGEVFPANPQLVIRNETFRPAIRVRAPAPPGVPALVPALDQADLADLTIVLRPTSGPAVTTKAHAVSAGAARYIVARPAAPLPPGRYVVEIQRRVRPPWRVREPLPSAATETDVTRAALTPGGAGTPAEVEMTRRIGEVRVESGRDDLPPRWTGLTSTPTVRREACPFGPALSFGIDPPEGAHKANGGALIALWFGAGRPPSFAGPPSVYAVGRKGVVLWSDDTCAVADWNGPPEGDWYVGARAVDAAGNLSEPFVRKVEAR